MLKVIIFDLDGTLINSIRFWLSLYKKTAKKFGIKIDEKEVAKRFGQKDVDILISLTPKNKQKEVLEYYHKLKLKEKGNSDLKKFRFVDKVLKELKKRNIKIAIATGNSRDIADLIIKKNKLDKFIDYSVTHNDVKRGKPYPDMLLKIRRYFKIRKKEILCIGDSTYDFKAAKRAGIKTGLVKTGVLNDKEIKKLKPDFIFKDIRDVLKIL
jgi:HAD superfamily hydrolase (TIGR01549 family)